MNKQRTEWEIKVGDPLHPPEILLPTMPNKEGVIMRVKIVIEMFIDNMPDQKQCSEMVKDLPGFDPKLGSAVDFVVGDIIDVKGLFDLAEDEYRILQIVPIEKAIDY